MALDHIENGDFSNTTSAEKGVCYICHCRKRDEDKGIFRGGNISYEGDLDICEDCIRRGADILGWLQPDRVKDMLVMINNLNIEISDAHKLINEQENALKALGYIGHVKSSALKRNKAKVAS